jgi:hypothetical protein
LENVVKCAQCEAWMMIDYHYTSPRLLLLDIRQKLSIDCVGRGNHQSYTHSIGFDYSWSTLVHRHCHWCSNFTNPIRWGLKGYRIYYRLQYFQRLPLFLILPAFRYQWSIPAQNLYFQYVFGLSVVECRDAGFWGSEWREHS